MPCFYIFQRAMFCSKPNKRKLPDVDVLQVPANRGCLMSPLKSLKLSPIPRNDENYEMFSSRDHLLQSKGKSALNDLRVRAFTTQYSLVKNSIFNSMNILSADRRPANSESV